MPKYLIVLIITLGLFFGFQSHAMTFSDGMLIKGSGPEVYVLEHGLKRWITTPKVFSGLFYSWDKIIRLSDSDLANFPPGNKLDSSGSFPDGALLKSAKNPKVYISDQGKLRWIPNPDIFNSNNFSWENIIIAPDNTIKNKGKGADAQNGEFLLLPTVFITEKPPVEIDAANSIVNNTVKVTFRYSGANPTGPISELSWETFLEGYDTRWQQTSQYTRAINLPGNSKAYKFYARSRNKSGKFSAHPASYSFKLVNFSLFYKKIKINSIKKSGTAELDEYIKISNSSQDSINITGFIIENKAGEIKRIPKGSEIFNPTQDYAGDIILGKGNSAIIFTGSSPIAKNFRLNKCAGYLNYYNFFLKIPEECPKPLDQDITGFSQDCRNYIKNVKTCGAADIDYSKIRYDNNCRSYITANLNYSGCLSNYRHYPDFLKNDWYVFLDWSRDFWDNQHDEAKLFDKDGNSVDTYSY
jgi:hypothetical protein